MSLAHAIEEVRKNLPRLQRQDDGRAPIGIVERLIMDSTWWLTHPTGRSVRAPSHWERITDRGGDTKLNLARIHFLSRKQSLAVQDEYAKQLKT